MVKHGYISNILSLKTYLSKKGGKERLNHLNMRLRILMTKGVPLSIREANHKLYLAGYRIGRSIEKAENEKD